MELAMVSGYCNIFWHRCITKLHIPEWPAWGSLTVIWGTVVEVICRKTGENEVPPEMTSQLTMSLKCKTSHLFPKIWKEGETIIVTGGNSTKQQYSRMHQRGGGGRDAPLPSLVVVGPHRRRLAGVHFRWGLRTGFRTQQNTPSSPSRAPYQEPSGPSGVMGPLKIDGNPNEEPMCP